MKFICIAFLCLLSISFLAAEGILGGAREAVREPKTSNSTSGRTSHSSSSSSHCGDDFFDALAAEICLYAFCAPWILPRHYLENSDDTHLFVKPVYSLDKTPFLINEVNTFDKKSVDYSSWSNSFGASYGWINEDTTRITSALSFEYAEIPIAIDARLSFLSEELADGSTDELYIGDVGLLCRYAQSEDIVFRSGLGFRFLDDDNGTNFGMHLVYEMEAYPVKPISIFLSSRFGNLGEAFVSEIITDLNAHWDCISVTAGYHLLYIDSVNLSGPEFGINWNF